MREGSVAALSASRTSASMARARPARCCGPSAGARRCLASWKSLTGSRTVFMSFCDHDFRQARGGLRVAQESDGPNFGFPALADEELLKIERAVDRFNPGSKSIVGCRHHPARNAHRAGEPFDCL